MQMYQPSKKEKVTKFTWGYQRNSMEDVAVKLEIRFFKAKKREEKGHYKQSQMGLRVK